MGRQTSSKGQGATRVAVLVAGCLLLAAVGDAFVSVSPSHQVTTPKPTWEVTAQPAHRNGGLAAPNTQVGDGDEDFLMNKKFILFLFSCGVFIALLIFKKWSWLKTRIPTTKTSPIWLIVISGLESKHQQFAAKHPKQRKLFTL